jgi:hypothetical protein
MESWSYLPMPGKDPQANEQPNNYWEDKEIEPNVSRELKLI